ncbi:MAG: ribbon-helix-helix domain-containing protein [Candidatus Humimicrobiaceae bacterium]
MDTKKRTHIVVSEELVEEIDRLSGKRKRSWFITQAVRKEIQRLNFLNAIKETAGAWSDNDHPEFKNGVECWVRSLREEDENRLKDLM